jgi:hypothetical protein
VIRTTASGAGIITAAEKTFFEKSVKKASSAHYLWGRFMLVACSLVGLLSSSSIFAGLNTRPIWLVVPSCCTGLFDVVARTCSPKALPSRLSVIQLAALMP